MNELVNCNKCGARIPSSDNNCRKCGTPLKATHRRDALSDLHRNQLWTAEYERKKFQLAPQGNHETEYGFIQRIDREKTQAVTERNLSIARAMPGSGSVDFEFVQRMKHMIGRMNHTLPAPEREPGCDDELPQTATG